MPSEFAAFEAKLEDLFESKGAEHRIGVKIQKERFFRDRFHWLRNTLRGAFDEFGSRGLTRLLERYAAEMPRPRGDYGYWGDLAAFLGAVASSDLDYTAKSAVNFIGACLAAQQLEDLDEIPADIPYFREYLDLFAREGRTIHLSTMGHLHEKYGLTGVASVRSENGKVVLTRAEKIFGRTVGAGAAARAAALAARRGWSLEADRTARLAKAAGLEGFFGLTMAELIALRGSEAGSGHELRALAEIVYPVWLPKGLGLTITYHCNASCGHCYNSSGPFRPKEALRWKQIEPAMRDWAALGIDEIGISGGEPFLFVDQLVEIVAGLRALGIRRIVPFSNGFWGKDKDAARSILRGLAAAGFGKNEGDQIKVSAGEFHGPHVDADAVLNLAEVHHEVLGRKMIVDLAFGLDRGPADAFVRRAKERGLAKIIDWRARNRVSRSGRAKTWFGRLPARETTLREIRCPVLARGAVYPGGETVYCTGTAFPKDHLRLDPGAGVRPAALLAAAQIDEKLPYLQFGSFADYAEDRPGGPAPDAAFPLAEASTPCSLCREIFA